MAKKATIENRVYIFDTLAEALLSGPAGELLTSPRQGDRARAMRALADVAYVSCLVADSGDQPAEAVRQSFFASTPEVPPVPSVKAKSKGKRRKNRKSKPDARTPDAEPSPETE